MSQMVHKNMKWAVLGLEHDMMCSYDDTLGVGTLVGNEDNMVGNEDNMVGNEAYVLHLF